MKGFCKFLIPLLMCTIMFVVTPGIAWAGDCQSASKVAAEAFEKFGTEAIAAGCSAIKIALSNGQEFNERDVLDCYKNAVTATSLTDSLTQWWNKSIAKNSWATLNARLLELNQNLKGNLPMGLGTRTFITVPPLQKDQLTLTITERDGKAKTSVVVCKHRPNGQWTELATRTFNDTNAQQSKTNEKQTIKLTGVQGDEVSVKLDNKSATNKFSYTLRAED